MDSKVYELRGLKVQVKRLKDKGIHNHELCWKQARINELAREIIKGDIDADHGV